MDWLSVFFVHLCGFMRICELRVCIYTYIYTYTYIYIYIYIHIHMEAKRNRTIFIIYVQPVRGIYMHTWGRVNSSREKIPDLGASQKNPFTTANSSERC